MNDNLIRSYLEQAGKYSFEVEKSFEINSNNKHTHLLVMNDEIVFLKEVKKKLEYDSYYYYEAGEILPLKGLFKKYKYGIILDNEQIQFSFKNKDDEKYIEEINKLIKIDRPPLRDENNEVIATFDKPSGKYFVDRVNLVGWSHRMEDYDKAKKIQNENKWEGRLSNVEMKLEPENEYDPNAVAVYVSDIKVGYLPKEINSKEKIIKLIQKGEQERLEIVLRYDYDSEEKKSENFLIVFIEP